MFEIPNITNIITDNWHCLIGEVGNDNTTHLTISDTLIAVVNNFKINELLVNIQRIGIMLKRTTNCPYFAGAVEIDKTGRKSSAYSAGQRLSR